jgi:hypothetical protein
MSDSSWAPWLIPVILTTQEAEIRKIAVQGTIPKKKKKENPFTKRADGVAQGVSLEFRPQYGESTEESNELCGN